MGTEQCRMNTRPGEGHIIGDLLRKYATQSAATWQIIGYHIAAEQSNFGLQKSNHSYLGLVDGKLGTTVEPPSDGNILRKIKVTWQGDCYKGEGFSVLGLHKGYGSELVIYVLYSNGNRSAQKNLNTLRERAGDSAKGVFAVASSHSNVATFKYHVQPSGGNGDSVVIEADEGVVAQAYRAVMSSLSGLNIETT